MSNNSPNSVQDPAVFVKVWDVNLNDLVHLGRPRHGFHSDNTGRKSRTRRRKKRRKSRRKSKVRRRKKRRKTRRKTKSRRRS